MKINIFKPFMLLLFLSVSYSASSQVSKSERLAFSKIPYSTKVAEVKSGKHLKYFQKLSAQSFIVNLIERGNNYFDKKYGKIKIEELYRDSIYTYFGNTGSIYLYPYYKVTTSDFLGISFVDINGKEIRSKFIAEIIPEADMLKAIKKERNCFSISDETQYKYKYDALSKKVDITCRWKIKCNNIHTTKIANKEYKATYDLITNQFVR